MRLETGLILALTIGALRVLNQLRTVSWIDRWLVPAELSLLVGVPLLHNWYRRLALPFFEKNRGEVVRSLKIFIAACAAFFPPFLVGSHLYQTGLFHLTFRFQSPPALWSALIPMSLTVAFAEEFFFRGWLQPILRRSLSGAQAILITALLFAASHSVIQLQWWHFAIFFPACVFGWLREKTGTITASVLFHAVSNVLVAWIGQCYR